MGFIFSVLRAFRSKPQQQRHGEHLLDTRQGRARSTGAAVLARPWRIEERWDPSLSLGKPSLETNDQDSPHSGGEWLVR